MTRPEYDADVLRVLAHIHKRQQEPGGTGAPEGYCEMHTYHVWEVLNALEELRPKPTTARPPHPDTMAGK